jgi:hypothetical protein
LTKGCGAGGASGKASFDSFGFTSELPSFKPRDLFPEKLIEKDDRDGVLAPEAAPLVGWPDCRLDDSPEPKEGVLATEATTFVGLPDCKLEERPEPNAGVLAPEEAPPVGWPDCKLDENTEPKEGVEEKGVPNEDVLNPTVDFSCLSISSAGFELLSTPNLGTLSCPAAF